MTNKDFLNEEIAPAVTGEEVANLLGLGDLYRKGKQEIAHDEAVREDIKAKFINLTERMNDTPR